MISTYRWRGRSRQVIELAKYMFFANYTHLHVSNGWVGDVETIFSSFVFKRIFVLEMHIFLRIIPTHLHVDNGWVDEIGSVHFSLALAFVLALVLEFVPKMTFFVVF